jgi:integrase
MGKIRQTEAGYLYFDFRYKGVRCKEYTELKNSSENMKLMKQALKTIESEIMLGIFSYVKYFPGSKLAEQFKDEPIRKSGVPFEEYANTWFKNNKLSWKPSVRRDFRSVMNRHLVSYFKDRPVIDITKWMVKEFRASLAEKDGRKGKKISNKRINNIVLVLRLIMNEASEQFDFPDPFTNFKSLKLKKTDIHPFAPKEVSKFLKHAPPEYRAYYTVRFFTGMRTAEVDGLQWKYVDFAAKSIRVRETWQNREWVSPKTESSNRDIDMGMIVEEALRRQHEKTGDGALVFKTNTGKPFDYNNISKRVWYPTLKKAKLTPRPPYQTRHTAATLWLASGENPEWVARQLGHANVEMLFKVYSRFIPNLTRLDGSAFEKFLDENLSGPEEQNNEEREEQDEEEK